MNKQFSFLFTKIRIKIVKNVLGTKTNNTVFTSKINKNTELFLRKNIKTGLNHSITLILPFFYNTINVMTLQWYLIKQ